MQFDCFNATKAPIAVLIIALHLGALSENLQGQTLVAVSPIDDPAAATAREVPLNPSPMVMVSETRQPVAAQPVNFSEPCGVPIATGCAPASLALSAPVLANNICEPNAVCHPSVYGKYHVLNHSTYPTAKQRKQACYWGYPEYFCEPALGAALATTLQTHKTLGDAEQFILFQCDFFPENSPLASQLNAYGKRRLEKLLCRSTLAGHPLRIERNADNPDLDELRRQQVLEYTSAINAGLNPDMVVLVGDVPGVSGIEAILHYQNQLSQVLSGASGGTMGDTAENFRPTTTANAPSNNQ